MFRPLKGQTRATSRADSMTPPSIAMANSSASAPQSARLFLPVARSARCLLSSSIPCTGFATRRSWLTLTAVVRRLADRLLALACGSGISVCGILATVPRFIGQMCCFPSKTVGMVCALSPDNVQTSAKKLALLCTAGDVCFHNLSCK